MKVEQFSEETLKAGEIFSRLDAEAQAIILDLLRALNGVESDTERTDTCGNRD